MRTYGRAPIRYTAGIVPYASSGAAQTAITATLNADNASAAIGGGTISGNTYTYISNGNTFVITYSIRNVAGIYYADTSFAMTNGMVWVEVDSDSVNGDTYPQLTTLIQNLKLQLGESPFFSDRGIPAQQSVMTQIFPDYYVTQIQSQFAPYFATLGVSKRATIDPTYDVSILTNQGVVLNEVIAV